MPTLHSSRFGTLEIPDEDVLHFERGLIGLGGSRYALLTPDPDGAFRWLHSVEDPDLALPVTDPWRFFPDYVVDLADADAARLGVSDPSQVTVWVTVRAAAELSRFTANLRAPILVTGVRAQQSINDAPDAPVRAPLFPELPVEQAAA